MAGAADSTNQAGLSVSMEHGVSMAASDDGRNVGTYCDELGIHERLLLDI